MQHSVPYTILFAGLICVVCAVLVSSSAVELKEMQQANAALDKRKNVLLSAGLAQPSDETGRRPGSGTVSGGETDGHRPAVRRGGPGHRPLRL